MKLVNLNGPQDVMALLVRRKWWIILPFIALSAGVVLITAILPQMYVSQSLVVIRPRDVPNDFVRDLIAGSTNERLSIITERVLSDTNLKKILNDNGDKLPEFSGLSPQEKIVKLRKQVTLKFSAGENLNKGQLPISAFRITGQNHNPIMAQTIVKQLTEVFIEEDSKGRQANVNDTAEFLQEWVADLADKLAASDKRLKELKSRRRDELPNQLESNLRRLENLSVENQGLRQTRTNYALALSQQEQMMAETPQRIPKPPPQVGPRDPEVDEYREMLKEAKVLTRRGYLDGHPDVQRLKLSLQRLEEHMTPEQIELAKKQDTPLAPELTPETDDGMQNNPAYVSMERNREVLKNYLDNIDEKTKQNDAAIKVYNQHVNNVPEGEQELTDVLRENNDLSRQYQEMNSKLAAAQLSVSAESQQKGTSFELVDSASLPLTPTKPTKSAIVSAGLMLSLLISLGIGFIVDIANQKTWTQSDIVSLLGVKVLVEVPRVVTREGAARATRKKVGFMTSVGVASIAYAVCLYLAFNHPGFVLRSLDPLIQKLY